jgi:hypothetical protein
MVWLAMAHRYAHPFRVNNRLPTFQTQHQAYDFLAEYQKWGFIQRCDHARVRATGSGGQIEGYVVHCAENSFELVQIPPASGLGIGDTSVGFSGCPVGCHLYKPRWRGTLTRRRERHHPMIWFGQQPWQVKVTIIAAPVLIAAAYFGVVRDLTTLVRAIVEAWRGQ